MAFLKLISKLTGASIKIENVTNINEEIEYYKYTYYRKNSIGIIETCTGEFNENIEGMLVDESTESYQLYNTKNKDKLTDDELMAFSKLDKGRTYVSDIDHDSIYSDSIKAFDFIKGEEVKKEECSMGYIELTSKNGKTKTLHNITNIIGIGEGNYKYTQECKNEFGLNEETTGVFGINDFQGIKCFDDNGKEYNLFDFISCKRPLTEDELWDASNANIAITEKMLGTKNLANRIVNTIQDKTFLCNPDKKIFTEEDSNDKLKNWMLSIVNNLPDAEVCRMAICTELAVKLASIRIEKYNASKEDMANKLCVKKKMIDKYESGCYNFTIKELANIADKLDLDLDICLK
jgi:DNA-binding XRE family transcriptional regulator